jgi:hypothetical protein
MRTRSREVADQMSQLPTIADLTLDCRRDAGSVRTKDLAPGSMAHLGRDDHGNLSHRLRR